MLTHRLITAVASLVVSFNVLAADPGPALSAPEALERIRAGTLMLIDVRRPEEWRQTGVAPGALRISMERPEGLIAFLRDVAREVNGNANAPIGLICRTGNRTTSLQKVMQELGFMQVYNVKEGMVGSAAGPGWIARGLPVAPCEHC